LRKKNFNCCRRPELCWATDWWGWCSQLQQRDYHKKKMDRK